MAIIFRVLRATLTVTLAVAGFIVLLSMYYKSPPSPKCHPRPAQSGWLTNQANFSGTSVVTEQPNSPAVTENTDKPILLLWFWPENKSFDFKDCKTLFKIDSCHLTDDRSLYSRAHGVLVFHRAIKDDLSNLPPSPRARFQRWIWFNMDPPASTRRIAGIQGLFNLTMSYRKDADIHVRWRLTPKKNMDDFVLPKKERLLCWIVDGDDLHTKSAEGYSYFRELIKHIEVDVYDRSSAEFSQGENYFLTISSCKFYLSFEESTHRDYITETFNGPLAAGTVPIVLGPPRRNYEDFAPGTSFIHVNDFHDAATLAEFLLTLDKDNEAYMRYFNWRRFYTARRHPVEENHEFAHAICQACHHVGLNSVYRVVPDLYKWLLL
ncbi:4-galactosyl-N-acetylglucosaminide 3-alpha-L-fucosyltransferase 9-like [Epinephelus fuscoguttatus]|uniref:4-galactosyl-N-acetylglucosaminide 3-alpha-L-fucosyltransferase 9-like n=1 Tax=Epinephelus fuscoguttatus TaxID=293821 RepID=UPI0020D10406|nr:4-galactosyl-N-acetylglucosaminide 3-alpha-L-fucosyltransferase 9-like [Epinephelus fuscoguttatus]